MAKNKKGGSNVVSHTKNARGAEQWCVRTSDGQLKTVTTSPSSAESMDRATKRYAAAMKRLAKR